MKRFVISIFFCLCCGWALGGDVLPLAGQWRIVVAPGGEGFAQKWYEGPLPTHAGVYPKGLGMQTNDYIDLPGSPDRAGIGTPLRPLSQITPDKEKPVEFWGPYWLQKQIKLPAGCKGSAVFLTDQLPEGSKLYWDGVQATATAGGFSIQATPGAHRATFFIGAGDPKKPLPAGGFAIACGGKRLAVQGRWRIVPEMHNNALAGEWSRGPLPEPTKLYIYYASYFRGANYTMADSVALPATPASAGIATLLNPSRAIQQGLERAVRYDGPFWVQRKVTVPAEWRGRDAVFSIERAPGMSKCYWDDKEVGECHGYDVPQRFTIPAALATPGEHTLTVYNSRSDNAYQQTGHGVKGENGVNWCGLLGRIELRRASQISNMQVYPDVDRNTLKVKADVEAADGVQVRFSYRMKDRGPFREVKTFAAPAAQYDLALPVASLPWDEFSPALYELRCEVLRDGKTTDSATAVYGMRKFEATPGGFLLNGKHIMLRGAQQCGSEPVESGTPMDRAYWDKICSETKLWGMNHLRFHSWTPPRAAFEAADEAGVILQIELPHEDIAGAPKNPGKELIRILDEYGNHPSFCLITLGNERFNHNDVSRAVIDAGRAHDPRHLYACTSHPVDNGCTDDFYISAWGINNTQPNGWGRPIVGIEWGGGDVVSKTRFNTLAPETRSDYRAEIAGNRAPIITHEVGQWTMFPHLDVMKKYTGVLVNTNYQRIEEKLVARGMRHQADRFADASGRFSAALYKEEVESVLRTPGLAGYSLLGINDFPGQHLSVVGMLDEFWDDKRIIRPEQCAQYSRAVVPLARMERRTWTLGKPFTADVEIANFGPRAFEAVAEWRLTDDAGTVVAKGVFPKKAMKQGALTPLGKVEAPLTMDRACRLVFSVRIPGLASDEAYNDWNIWAYPAASKTDSGRVKVLTRWDAAAKKALDKGETVLLIPDKESLSQGYRDACFVPVFWNSIFKWMQRAHTMGVLCDPAHPALADFPTDGHSDWQWWDIATHANAMYLNDLPHGIEPLVQVIDSYVFCDKLAYLWECRVGKGKLVVCTVDLLCDLSARPASRQLLGSVLQYMNGAQFDPAVSLDAVQVDALFRN